MADSNIEPRTYDMHSDDEGWTAYIVRTDEPAQVNSVPQAGPDIEKAHNLMDLLNLMARQKGESASH